MKNFKSSLILIHFDNWFASFADANPFDWHVKILFDEANVVLGIFGQVTEVPDVDSWFFPAWKRHVFNLYLTQVGDGAWEVIDNLAVELVAKKMIRNVKVVS